jgi:site-specific DNA recombinase
MKAAHYARVSTEDQAHNYSISTQIEACQKLADELGYTVDQEHILIDDGYSGATLQRPGLERLRRLAEQGTIQSIICYDPDRLSRKLVHLLLLTEEWERQGVTIHFVLHPTDSSPESKMFFQLKGIFAEYERAKFMERSLRGKRKRLQEGKVQATYRPTYGYDYHAKRTNPNDPLVGKYTINPTQADIVKQIFQWFLEDDLSTKEIARRLVAKGTPSPTGLGRWHRATVANILKNYTYAGIMYHNRREHGTSQKESKKTSQRLRPKDEWIEVAVPDFILKEWVELAREKLEQHKRRCRRNSGHRYLLSGMGILWCACGAAMTGRARTRKSGKIYRWYDCNRKYPGYWPQERCQIGDLNGSIADEMVWEEIKKVILNPALLIDELHRRYQSKEEELNRLRQDLEVVEERLRKVNEEREDLAYMGRKRFFGPRTLEIVASEAKKLEFEEKGLLEGKADLEHRLGILQVTEEDVNYIEQCCQTLRRNLDNLSFEERRRLVGILANRIVWDGQTLHIELVVPPEKVPILEEQHSL